jgi:hypothetical protein
MISMSSESMEKHTMQHLQTLCRGEKKLLNCRYSLIALKSMFKISNLPTNTQYGSNFGWGVGGLSNTTIAGLKLKPEYKLCRAIQSVVRQVVP